MQQFIVISHTSTEGDHVVEEVFPLDTVEERAVAAKALQDAGLEKAPVYAGEAPDTVATSTFLVVLDAEGNDVHTQFGA